MSLQGKALWGIWGYLNPEGQCSFAGGNGPVTSITPWDRSPSLALQKGRSRGATDVSTSCRCCDGTAQLGELDVYGACGWPILGFSEPPLPLSTLDGATAFVFWLYQGLCGQSWISVLSHLSKKEAIQVPARTFHFMFALTTLSQGNDRFGILLVPCLCWVSWLDGTWQHCWGHRLT